MTGLGLLDDVRVLDLAGEATAQAGRMLADLGGDVVLVESPDDPPSRRRPPLATTPSGEIASAHFTYTAAGKRSVTIDLAHPRGQTLFRQLVGVSDVLLTDAAVGEMEAIGLGYDALRTLHPGLVYTSVTPFGLTGPRRRWRGSDLVGWAASGAMPAIGDADRAPSRRVAGSRTRQVRSTPRWAPLPRSWRATTRAAASSSTSPCRRRS